MDMLTEALERFFSERITHDLIRTVEAGSDSAPLWAEIEASGFLDMLLPEEKGGAGLALGEVFPAFLEAGAHAVPLPFVQTVLARAWLQAQGMEPPAGRIAIAGPEASRQVDGSLVTRNVAFGTVADWVLAGFNGEWALLPADASELEFDQSHGSQFADFLWAAPPSGIPSGDIGKASIAPEVLAAAALVPLMAGASRRILEMTLSYVGERQQFGRPIAQFQAVQNQLSVMAERVWAMRMAARLAFHAQGGMPSMARVAMAKTRCGEAAVQVADIAHALHGAIGITEEYALQLYTRRLREWRRAGGGEAWWARKVGAAVLESQGSVLDFILDHTRAEPVD